MNIKINKSKSLYNIPNNKKKGKSLNNIKAIETSKAKTDKEKKDIIRKMRESNPSY
jgi:hypothetical protein